MSDVLEQFLDKKAVRAKQYRKIIESMLGRWESYGYAETTLIAILDFVQENNHITDAQIQAIENIKRKPSKRYGL